MSELVNAPSSNSLKENESTNGGPSTEMKMVSPPNEGVDVKDEEVGADASADDEDKLLADLEESQKNDPVPDGPLAVPTLLGGAVADEEKLNESMKKEDQLDELLDKAKEYSNFIAKDLRKLREDMARKAAAKKKDEEESTTQEKGKKRTKNAASNPSKRTTAGTEIFIQPENLREGCNLMNYQLEGLRWLASLYENGVSGILADEMGLGKTIQVIALLAHLRKNNTFGPHLIVAPLATLPNWTREIEKWLPDANCLRYHGTKDERDAFFKNIDATTGRNTAPLLKKKRKEPNFPIIVTSYEVAIRDQKQLSTLASFSYLIVDEGQRLKNRKCCLIKNLKMIKAANRLLLSGTPIQNNLDELWSLLNFINPTIFDDLSVFQSWFGFKDIGVGGTDEEEIVKNQKNDSIVSKLHEIMRPFLLRRIKKDVLTDMPPKKEVIVYAGMSKLQKGYENHIKNHTLRDELMKTGIEGAKNISQVNPLMNHRKNCNHPFLFGEPIDPASGQHIGTTHPQILIRASGKFTLLDRMLTKLWADKHQVLIFSQMTSILSIIEDYLILKNWKYCRIDGSTKIDDRQNQMDAFNAEKTNGKDGGRNNGDDRHFVFLLSTRAGGLGINLASADTCIIFDSDWNPHQDSQAQDRCHRIGQNKPVAVYRLLTAGANSADMGMMSKAISKKKLDRMVIAGGDFREGGTRSRGDLTEATLSELLADDIKKEDVEDIKISEQELDLIMDRKRLFGDEEIPADGKMYSVLEDKTGESDLLKSTF